MHWLLTFGLFLSVAVSSASSKKIVLIADIPDGHEAGTHEYGRGVRLLKHCLDTSANVKGIETKAYYNGWPDDSTALEEADTIVLYTTGANYGIHPLLQTNRLQQLDRLMARGVGLVCLHYTLNVKNDKGGGGPELLEWIGGYNDYQNNYSSHTVTEKNPPEATQASPGHPISRGWKSFTTRNEFYIKQRFRAEDPRFTPILTTQLPVEKPERQVVAWAVERAGGGRGFGFTDGHFHSNWGLQDYRKMVLNAIIWTARLEVPNEGVLSKVSAEDLKTNESPAPESASRAGWKSLFDGKTLNGWKSVEFGGEGAVRVEEGKLIVEAGAVLSGVNLTNPTPKVNYEVELEAMKIEGQDFFCGLTFPVQDSFATFVMGGWGGGVTGISSVDGMDASENETAKFLGYDKGRWYKIRLRVTTQKIEVWTDQEKVVDLALAERKIALRPGPIDLSAPFGLATYQTTAAYRGMRIRSLSETGSEKKIALIAGKKSHGPGEHEYEKGLALLKECLDSAPGLPALRTEIYTNGWPASDTALDDAATIVLYCDGSDRDELAHPLLVGNRLETLARQMRRGAGFVAIHYTVFVPAAKGGAQLLDWAGGYFDYESGKGANHWFSKIETKEYSVVPSAPFHPILKGVKPFNVREEFYFNMKFLENDPRRTPILSFASDRHEQESLVGWAVEREDGGRGFSYTGGHSHKNWQIEPLRKMILNAIVWTAKIEVPSGGVESLVKR